MRLLVVCLGNICRSPMGEGALRQQIAQAGLAGRIEVDSAGTSDWHIGRTPDPRAIACAGRHGADISALKARQLLREDFSHFDLILCADQSNLDDARAIAPADSIDKAVLWLPWLGLEGPASVPDPYYGDERDFEHSWSLVDAAARATVQRLSATVDSGIIGP